MTTELADEQWTSDYLIDRLKSHLSQVKGVNPVVHRPWLVPIYGDRKYWNQAFDLLSIGALKPVPSFIIYLSDLTPKLRKELASLDKQSRRFVVVSAVGRIFEDINSKLYNNSVSRVLKVKFEK